MEGFESLTLLKDLASSHSKEEVGLVGVDRRAVGRERKADGRWNCDNRLARQLVVFFSVAY